MKIIRHNLYIQKHGDGLAIYLEMPNESRNYLHTEVYGDIDSIIEDYDFLLDDKGINNSVLKIQEEDSYYRIYLRYIRHDTEHRRIITFHSRKLNINDVLYERLELLSP